MDPSVRNAAGLKAHINKLTESLVTRFESILALAAPENEAVDYNTTSHNSLAMKEETAALIRTAEDILTLTRQMQELWLFGTVDTLAEAKDGERSEESVAQVAGLIERLVRGQEVRGGGLGEGAKVE